MAVLRNNPRPCYKDQLYMPGRVTRQRPKSRPPLKNRNSHPESIEPLRSMPISPLVITDDQHGLLVGIDQGGHSIKATKHDTRNPRDDFVKSYGGDFSATSESKQYAPSRLMFKDGKAMVGFCALESQSLCIADLKRLCTCDRNEEADLAARNALASELGKHDDDVDFEDWYTHLIRYIVHALEKENSFEGDPIIYIIHTFMYGTPKVHLDIMTDIIKECFDNEKTPRTIGWIESVSEPQAALRHLSNDLTTKGEFVQDRMVILVDIGGTSVDFIAGVYDSKLGVLRSRYCPLSLVYGGVDLDRKGTEIVCNQFLAAGNETHVRTKITGWMSQLTQYQSSIAMWQYTLRDISNMMRTPEGRQASIEQELSEQLSTAIDEHRNIITQFVTRETQSSLDRVDMEERKSGIMVCLLGGGSQGLEGHLELEIRKAIRSKLSDLEQPDLPDTDIIIRPPAQSVREVVPLGAMKILHDLVIHNKGSKYKTNYCIRRCWENSDVELTIVPEVILRQGTLYFPDQEFVHIMHDWIENDKGLPLLPSRIAIYSYYTDKLQAVQRKEKSGRMSEKKLVEFSDSQGLWLGEIKPEKSVVEEYMYLKNTPQPESDEVMSAAGTIGEAARAKNLGTLLEYQLILSVSSSRIKAKLRTAQMDSKLVPPGKPRMIELGSMLREGGTGED